MESSLIKEKLHYRSVPLFFNSFLLDIFFFSPGSCFRSSHQGLPSVTSGFLLASWMHVFLELSYSMATLTLVTVTARPWQGSGWQPGEPWPPELPGGCSRVWGGVICVGVDMNTVGVYTQTLTLPRDFLTTATTFHSPCLRTLWPGHDAFVPFLQLPTDLIPCQRGLSWSKQLHKE